MKLLYILVVVFFLTGCFSDKEITEKDNGNTLSVSGSIGGEDSNNNIKEENIDMINNNTKEESTDILINVPDNNVEDVDLDMLAKINEVIADGDLKKAEQMYLLKLEKYPDHGGLKDGLGYLYLSMGKEEKAGNYLSVKAINGYVDTSDLNILEEINKVITNGDLEKAEQMYLSGLKKYPDHSGLKEGLGHLYISMGEKEKAKKYMSVEEIDSYIIEMGKLNILEEINEGIKKEIENGNLDKVEQMYLSGLDKYPNHAGLKEGLGHIYLSMGEKEKARAYLPSDIVDGYVVEVVDNSKIDILLEEINEIIADGDLKKAEQMYLSGLEKYPNHEGIKESLGHLYLSLGLRKKALDYLPTDIVEGY